MKEDNLTDTPCVKIGTELTLNLYLIILPNEI